MAGAVMNYFNIQRVENGFIVTDANHRESHLCSKVWVFSDEKTLAKWIEKEMPKLLAVKK